MNSNFKLFLSNVKCNDTNQKTISNDCYDDRIIFRDKKKIDNFTFNVFTYKLCYPISLDKLVTADYSLKVNCMEERFDTTILIEYNDNEKNEVFDINDVAYTSMSTVDEAKNEYDKLHNIIFSANSSEEIFKELNRMLNYD